MINLSVAAAEFSLRTPSGEDLEKNFPEVRIQNELLIHPMDWFPICCHNEPPQAYWLKTTQLYNHIVF